MHAALWILLAGVLIVIGGVLVLRLHAFLALVLAALVVGALTPPAFVETYATQKAAAEIVAVDLQDEAVRVHVHLRAKQKAAAGSRFVICRVDQSRTVEVGRLEVERVETVPAGGGKSKTIAVGRVTEIADGVTVQTSDIAVPPPDRAAAVSLAKQTVGERVANAFGGTCAKIGILIAMAAIIGKCLLDSGAADRIVRSALKVVGERGAPAAFAGSGFLLGIPVFFDTVFYLMVPLGKAMRMRTGRNYLLYILTIVAGATMAHSLVPPTPGPLLVAEELGVDLGVMILGGCIVGLFSSSAGICYAYVMNRRSEVPLRESPDFSLADVEELSQRDEGKLPPLWLSLLPILLPVLLITTWTGVDAYFKAAGISGRPEWTESVKTLGNKNIALTIATAIAMAMLVWQRRTNLKELGAATQAALASGGVIILITSGGGAFGAVLQQTGVAGLLGRPEGSSLLIIALAFFITTAVRTAQGSATVAMITAVGILSGFAGQLGCHDVYLALAIGCGSKPIAWMNDSGFWVICKMSGMTEAEGLKFVTPMSIIMGLVGLLATMAGAVLLPLN